MRIAIVEDEKIFSSTYVKWLEQFRPAWAVECFEDGSPATVQRLLHGDFDTVLLDIILGARDPTGGFRVLRRLFEYFGDEVPTVLVLTGTPHSRDIEIMRALAVHEVSTKPTAPSELLGLIDYILKSRTRPARSFVDLTLHPYRAFRNCLRGPRGAISLTQTEISILHELLETSPAAVSTESLKKLLISGDVNAVQQAISSIRTKLESLYTSEELEDRPMKGRLATVPTVGYCWHG